jgi:hypothetical protein
MEPFGGGFRIVQHTIDAVPDLQFILEWLDMNITGPVFNSSRNDKVSQSDYRGLGRKILEMSYIIFFSDEFVSRLPDILYYTADVTRFLPIEFRDVFI